MNQDLRNTLVNMDNINWRRKIVFVLLPADTEVTVSGDSNQRNVYLENICIFQNKIDNYTNLEFADEDGFYELRTLGDLKNWLEED